MKKFVFIALALAFLMSPVAAQAQISPKIELQVENGGNAETPQDRYLSYNFGSTWVGSSRSIIYSITAGDTESRFREIVYSGMGFHADTNCPNILPAHATCDVRITFSPVFTGPSSGRVVIDLYTRRFIINLWGHSL